jgi:hypothetical protein
VSPTWDAGSKCGSPVTEALHANVDTRFTIEQALVFGSSQPLTRSSQ